MLSKQPFVKVSTILENAILSNMKMYAYRIEEETFLIPLMLISLKSVEK